MIEDHDIHQGVFLCLNILAKAVFIVFAGGKAGQTVPAGTLLKSPKAFLEALTSCTGTPLARKLGRHTGVGQFLDVLRHLRAAAQSEPPRPRQREPKVCCDTKLAGQFPNNL